MPPAKALTASHPQGYQPRVSIYRQADLQLLQTIPAGAEFGYTAVGLSGDGELLAVCSGAPDQQLSVWQWRKVSGSGNPAKTTCMNAVAVVPFMAELLTGCSSGCAGAA